MNCDCIERVDKKLSEAGHDYRVAAAFVFDKTMAASTQLKIETYYPVARRGRKSSPGIICTYCPFCGVKTATEGI